MNQDQRENPKEKEPTSQPAPESPKPVSETKGGERLDGPNSGQDPKPQDPPASPTPPPPAAPRPAARTEIPGRLRKAGEKVKGARQVGRKPDGKIPGPKAAKQRASGSPTPEPERVDPPPLWTADEAAFIVTTPYEVMAVTTGHDHWMALAKRASKFSSKAQYVLNYYAKDAPIKLVLGILVSEMSVLFLQGLGTEIKDMKLRKINQKPPETEK